MSDQCSQRNQLLLKNYQINKKEFDYYKSSLDVEGRQELNALVICPEQMLLIQNILSCALHLLIFG